MKESKNTLPVGKMIGWIIGGTSVAFGAGVLVIWFVLDGDWSDKAPIGDALNSLTALFSALALAAVVLSLWYQHREVSVTIEEMKDANESNRGNLEKQAEIAEAMRMQAEALYRPYVTIRLEIGWDTTMYVVVENTGQTAAYDLKLTTDQQGSYPGGDKRNHLSNSTLFRDGTATFAPGQRIKYLLTSGKSIKESDPKFEELPSSFQIVASYRYDGRDVPVRETTVIDLLLFVHSIVEREPPELTLQKMQKSLSSIAEHTKRATQ